MSIALLSFFLTYCIVCAVRTFPMELSEDKGEELDMRTVSYRVSLGKLERIQFLCLMNCKEFVVCRPEFSIKLTDSLNSFESAELG